MQEATLMRARLQSQIKPSRNEFLTGRLFLALIGVCMVAVTIVLWKTQEDMSLSQVAAATESKVRSYASETEIRYNNLYNALERLASRGARGNPPSVDEWEQDVAFYIDSFKGIKSIAWVDESYRIRLMAPLQKNASNLNQLANEVQWDPLDINVWAPIYDGLEFEGYILATVDLATFMSPVVSDVKDDYMLQLTNEQVPIFASENWQVPSDDLSGEGKITLRNAMVSYLTLAPTARFVRIAKADSRRTLAFGFLLSCITLAAVYLAQKYSILSRFNELRYRKTLESMIEGCQIIGPDWRFLFVNETAAHQYQLSREELVGHTLVECRPGIEETELYPLLQRCMTERASQKTLSLSTAPDGAENWYELSIQPAPDGIVILSNEVSERKRAEQQILKLNAELESRVRDRTAQLQAANQELEAFAYSVSHDLRAPLRALDGFSAALLAQYAGALDEQGQHYLDRIQQASQRMGQLISDLLNLSRVTRAEFTRQPVDLAALAREIAAEIQQREPLRQAQFGIADQLSVQGDAALLRIALRNLLENAWKFTGTRTETRIEVGVIDDCRTAIADVGEASKSAIGNRQSPIYYVRDNGVGFDMAYAAKLFVPFQRLHAMHEFPGTGIGLVTVQRIITRHGGRIWTEAAVDQGATFYFTL